MNYNVKILIVISFTVIYYFIITFPTNGNSENGLYSAFEESVFRWIMFFSYPLVVATIVYSLFVYSHRIYLSDYFKTIFYIVVWFIVILFLTTFMAFGFIESFLSKHAGKWSIYFLRYDDYYNDKVIQDWIFDATIIFLIIVSGWLTLRIKKIKAFSLNP